MEEEFGCMVVRYTDTDNEQVGREILTADEIVAAVDARRGGTYLTVYKKAGYENLTPACLQYKGDAKDWARKVKRQGEER